MRPLRLCPPPADPLSSALRAHAAAEDQRREAERIVAGLTGRRRGALAAAAAHRRLGDEALRRGEESAGLAHHDAAIESSRAAREAAVRLGDAGRRARDLAVAEEARRAELFRAIARFLSEVESR